MTREELDNVIEKHRKWLENSNNGTSAYLIGADLSNADLIDANLKGAYLSGANLTDAYLIGADLMK